ncbi:hypothetical protein CTI12_AA453810 [Artemisia annua]|uniref:RWP-RK domain-containing protein n=1 Tax=Artemisia annua TaxID=35608 RepID=A0A2U1LUE5_ARTAN|nr:hypothetical protein CTI12_AA453810 [Artemisia annua]
MINKSSAASLAVASAVAILSFVCPPEIVNVGLVFFDNIIFNPLPHNKSVPKAKEVIKEKIFSALATLSLLGQQSVLVQLWSPTKAGNTFLLYTCPTFGSSYEIDKGLMVYRRGCLRHAFYIHRDKNVSFGLPGLAFMEGTPQQTQDVHNYPEDQRPPCEDDSIFSMKWGSFTVPVTLDDECVGVLEFVLTGPTGPYDVYMKEVCKALEFVGFQSSLKLDTPKRTCIAKKSSSSIEYDAPKETESSKKKTRTTQSSMYAHYNVLVPLFGLSKAEAMKEIANIFHLKKIVKESTFTNALRKVGITEWPWIRNTPTRASSSAPETQSNPTASEAASSIGTPDSVLTSVCDEGISEQLREQTSTPIASAFEAQLYQIPLETSPFADDFNQYWDSGVSEMSWEQIPTIEPSALGLPERLLAFVRELDEMEEDQDGVGAHDHGRFNDISVSFEECFYDTCGGMEIDTATSVLRHA